MLGVGAGVVTRLGRGDCRQLTTRREDERWMRKPDESVERPCLTGGADGLVVRVVRGGSAGIDVGRVPEPRARFTERTNADSELRHQCQQGGSSQKDRSERNGSWRAHRK